MFSLNSTNSPGRSSSVRTAAGSMASCGTERPKVVRSELLRWVRVVVCDPRTTSRQPLSAVASVMAIQADTSTSGCSPK